MSNSNISVVIPFYNRSQFLERTLDGVLSQTLQPVIIYIVDNGSNEQEQKKVNEIILLKKYYHLNISFLSTEENGNANYARNLGYKFSQTKYVAFLDSDDWWRPQHLEHSLETLKRSGRSAIYSGAIIHNEYGDFVKYSIDVNYFDNPFDLMLSKEGHMAVTPSYLIDKECVGDSVVWDTNLKRHQDFDYFASIFYRTTGWCYLSEANVNVDWKDGGTKNKDIDFQSLILFYEKWQDKIPVTMKKQYLMNRLSFCYREKTPKFIKNFYRDEIRKNNYFNDQAYKLKSNSLYIYTYVNIAKALDFIGIKESFRAINKYLGFK